MNFTNSGESSMLENNGITYRLAADSDSTAWDEYVNAHPQSTFSHRWHWSSVLVNSFAVSPRYCLALHRSKIVGVLPSVLMKSLLFGRYLISLPWLDYGGVLADSTEIARSLISYAIAIAENEKCRFVELRAVRQVHPELLSKTQKYSFLLDLTGTEEEVWKSIDSKAKNQVRKAIKSDLQVKFGKVELLNEFYKIFSRNMRDLGTPVWPKKLFSEQFKYFPEDTEFAIVNLGEKPIAAGLIIHYKNYSTVPSASSYREYLKLCPNNILYWEIIKHCLARGSTVFDFGRSSLNAGTYNFKKQWVKNPQQQNWQYKLLTIEDLPELNPSNPKFSLGIKLWKKLPLPIANILGPRIVTKLP